MMFKVSNKMGIRLGITKIDNGLATLVAFVPVFDKHGIKKRIKTTVLTKKVTEKELIKIFEVLDNFEVVGEQNNSKEGVNAL